MTGLKKPTATAPKIHRTSEVWGSPLHMKSFNLDNLKPFYADAPSESTLPNAALCLAENMTYTTRETKRTFAEFTRLRSATQTLERLPEPGESIQAILRGDYSLFDTLAAIVELAGQPIDHLHVVTLSMSDRNVDRLDQWATEGKIHDLKIIVSCYHAAADKKIFDHASEVCARHGFQILPMRSHAKMLAVAFGDQRITCESSANLRSCRNVENLVLYADPGLYEWHTAWMNDLLERGAHK